MAWFYVPSVCKTVQRSFWRHDPGMTSKKVSVIAKVLHSWAECPFWQPANNWQILFHQNEINPWHDEIAWTRSICIGVYEQQQVVKVIWHKPTSPPKTESSIVFTRWRQCALTWEHIGATWQVPLNLCFLWPTRIHNPNNKSIGSAVFAQLTAESPYTLQWGPLSPKIAPSHGWIWAPSNLWFLRLVRTTTQERFGIWRKTGFEI